MSANVVPARVVSVAFWRAYGITLRPYLCFVSGTSGLLGLVLGGELHPVRFAIASAVFFLSYGLGQALTDVFQTDTDAISSPYRPLVRGEITRVQVLAVSVAGLCMCALVLVLLNPWTIVPAVACVAGLATYTSFKRRWWGGPPWNSLVVALLPVLGLLCTDSGPLAVATLSVLGPAMASVFFSYAIFVLLGYFKDVEADRATGYQTLPVRFGRRVSVAVSTVFLVAAVTSSVLLLARVGVDAGRGEPGTVAGLALWLAGVALLAAAHVRIADTTRDDEAHPAIAMTVGGYVAMHLGEVVVVRPALALPALVLVALCAAALRRRPCRTQV